MNNPLTHPPHEGGLTRRSFLKLSAAAGVLGALGPTGLWAASDDVIRRAIPSSGQKIPVIGLGTARTFDVDERDAEAMNPLRGVMKNFFDGGGRMVESFGCSHPLSYPV